MSRAPFGRAVVFDIGWVLLHLTPQPLLRWLETLGVSHHGIEDLAARVGIEAHESGRLDGPGLLANIVALAPQAADTATARRLWLDMFDPQPAMFDLVARLRRRYRVFLLSNIGDLHWEHIAERYQIESCADAVLQSYRAGVMKPHAGIYEMAEQRFALTPSQTVFIDDRSDNIAAVQLRGWHGIVHRDAGSTSAELRRLGFDDT
jgi:HAD superfamily hydrolase (TIGR01509 family)